MKIKLFRSPKNRQWYFHIVGRNGKIIAASEGYNRRADAARIIERMRALIPAAPLSTNFWI